jgi:nitroimidazol reductase NimA-like FMN-containing flavoprotein (pyridoxamine 5'-phosphate oxidase superfamily)
MRKKDKEIKDKSVIESIIKRATVCRIALSEDNIPYFHSAKEGRKIDMMRKNNTVCFEIDIDSKLIEAEHPCDWSTKYYSIIGFGEAFLVEDLEEKREALDIIMEHYSGKSPFEYPEKPINSVAIIKVKIESMTGKKSGY